MVFAALLAATGCGIVWAKATETGTSEQRVQQPAAVDAPDALIRDLYRVHGEDFKTNKDRIISGKSRKYLDKYFDKYLADFIWKDQTTHNGEIGAIDFDLFYNAQDAKIANLQIGRAVVTGERASVPVSFTNFGKKEKLVYKLVQESGAWKISDISYGNSFTLLKVFKDAK